MHGLPSHDASSDRETSTELALELEGLHVLLVEDCVDQGRLYLHLLKTAGADVTLECNGAAAFDTVKKTRYEFDAIVMDFLMPEMDGIECTKRLRDYGYSETIVAVTAAGSLDLKERWFEAGCDIYLEKPFSRKSLIESILKMRIAKQVRQNEIMCHAH